LFAKIYVVCFSLLFSLKIVENFLFYDDDDPNLQDYYIDEDEGKYYFFSFSLALQCSNLLKVKWINLLEHVWV
jgi:hypothetical protein